MHYLSIILVLSFMTFSSKAMYTLDDQSRFISGYDYGQDEPLFLNYYSNGTACIYRIYENSVSLADTGFISQGKKMIWQKFGCGRIRALFINQEKDSIFVATCINKVPDDYVRWNRIYDGQECDCNISQR